MKTIREDVGRRKKVLIVACALLGLASQALAQDITITNPDQLAQVALSANYSIDCHSSLGIGGRIRQTGRCGAILHISLLGSLPMSTNFMTCIDWSNIPLASVILTKNILSGVTTMQSSDSTNVVATIAAPSDYQPGRTRRTAGCGNCTSKLRTLRTVGA